MDRTNGHNNTNKNKNPKLEQSAHEVIRAHFAEVYDKYGTAIFRFCALKVSDRDRAQDFTQEVFTRYWQTVRDGTVIKNERAYLYTLARNIVIDWYRRKKESSLDVLTDAGIEFPASTVDLVSDHAEAIQVAKAIDTLEQDDKEVLILRFIEGLSPQDIAKIRKETANSVSVRINRAVKKVQERLHMGDSRK